jgi:hypothetical protein
MKAVRMLLAAVAIILSAIALTAGDKLGAIWLMLLAVVMRP